jgi:Ser/Thr protein kinase RdoA (MazF antagonist)
VPAVVHATFAADDLSRDVAARYDLGAVESAVLWRSFISDVYRIEAGGRPWWLRVQPARWRTIEETRAEAEVLLRLGDVADIAVKPVRMRDGSHVGALTAPEGDRAMVLFEHAPGGPLGYFGEDGARHAARYGEAEAQLHAAFSSLPPFTARPAFDVAAMLTDPAAIVAAQLTTAELGDFERIVGRVRAAVSAKASLTIAVCHGDLNSENIHFEADRFRVIDFDICGDAPRAFELAAFSKGVTGGARDVADRLIGAFLDGYHRQGSTTADDLAVLPAMMLAQRIWVGAIHLGLAQRWGAQSFGRVYLERLVKWLRDWEDILDTTPAWARG